MSGKASVDCYVQGLRLSLKAQHISFDLGSDLCMTLDGQVGPLGISATGADLLDFAAAVYQIEKQLTGRQRTNPPERFELRMQLRNPIAWNDQAVVAAGNMLHLLGNAVWTVDFKPGLRAPIPAHRREGDRSVTQVALLSGGVDSTCGVASLQVQASSTQLVSFYTRQKTLQRNIASNLGFSLPSQWYMNWAGEPGRGHSFHYRSFLFLALAAVVAESWGARTIFQFENGVLATAIPPASSWMMTKHAHPLLHQAAADLFSALFGGDWHIQNPFLLLTKQECVHGLVKSIGEPKALRLLSKTETCWFHWSNRVVGGKKPPGVPCGLCIPCIVRRTAIPHEVYEYDLRRDNIKNDTKKGLAFRSYFGFLDRVIRAGRAPTRFYALLPAAGRDLVGLGKSIPLNDLHRLFLKFAREFMRTYF